MQIEFQLERRIGALSFAGAVMEIWEKEEGKGYAKD